jgi:hypothetical protein
MIIKGVLDSTCPRLHNGLRKIKKKKFNLHYEYPHTKKSTGSHHRVTMRFVT